jgi:gliding motility-associated transport system ATP-binding protein
MIDVTHLTKKYGDFTAVNDISFTAHPGQVTGFLGPNGAGKTTTMRILTGFMPPTSGKAMVAEYDVFEQSMDVREQVGYLPENVPLYRDMSAIGYLMFIGEMRGLAKRKDKAKEVLERVGLQDRAKSRIRTLSKGMKQRLGLASAIMHNPPVLILDEPTIGLDPRQVLDLRDLIRELGRDHTVLFSTHILSEAEQVCDKVVIINRGEIVAEGAPTFLRQDLERGGRILLRTNAPFKKLKGVLNQLDDIEDVTQERDTFIVTPVAGEVDVRPDIAQAIVQNSWELIELRQLAMNLEEIFLEVTQQETIQP